MPDIEKCYEKNYLSVPDFAEGEKKTLTIREVKSGSAYSQYKKAKERKARLYFKEKVVSKDEFDKPILDEYDKQIIAEVKPLILNATNKLTLKSMFGGGDFTKWVGKPITLYIDKKVRGNKKGIRIQGETEAVQDPIIPCDQCSEIITKTAKSTVEKLCEIGQAKYGKNLCAKCLNVAAVAEKAAVTSVETEE